MSPDVPRPPRRGHLREVRDESSPTVPELLATDALLDRLGRHEATDGDLHDTVARILDTFALHADPETAGVRPLPVPALEEVPDDAEQTPPEPVRAPRVLTARRRTLDRLGRGGVAAAAVLALMGGTAAAAATGGGNVLHPAGPGGSVSASAAAGLPAWVPDAVFEVFGGSTEQRAQNTIAQAQELAASGDPADRAKAQATVAQVVEDLKGADVPPEVLLVAQAAVANLGLPSDLTAVAVPGAVPESLLQTIAGVNRTVATPTPTSTWRVPLVTTPPTSTDTPTTTAPTGTPTTGTPTGTPTTAPPSGPTTTRPAPDPTTPAPTGTGYVPSTPVPSSPAPSSPAPSSPGPVPTTGAGGQPTTPTQDPPTPTDTTGSPTVPTTPTGAVPVVPGTPVTTDPVVPTATETATNPVSAPVATTDPAPVVGPVVLDPVVEPSPEAGVVPSPTDEVPVVATTSTDSGEASASS